MADQRAGGIAWTHETWNPLRGCSRVSAGCVNCYAERQAVRMAGKGQAYHGLVRMTSQGPKWTGKVDYDPDKALEPLRWRRPRRIFVNSMSDLFHEAFPVEQVAIIFAVMMLAQRHQFQVLTKRPERMRDLLVTQVFRSCVEREADELAVHVGYRGVQTGRWPLPNVWLGVSVEDQAAADERIPLLLQTPAAVRWISAEPLLGPVSLVVPFAGAKVDACHGALPGLPHLDWVVVGGESGPSARVMWLDWARDIVRDCRAAGVPVFMKQLGARPLYGAAKSWPISDRAGKVMADWPEELRVQEWPR